MKVTKFVLLIITAVALSLIFSSCTINFFKNIDPPHGLLNIAESAVEAANSGDNQTAIELSTNVLIQAGGFSSSMNLFNALTISATSSQSRNIIISFTLDIKKVEKELMEGNISKASTTAIAIKYAAIAMLRATSQVKKMEIFNLMTRIFDALTIQNSQNEGVKAENFLTLNATTISKTMLLILPLTRDIPTMNMLSELSNLISIYDGSDEVFKWNTSTLLYGILCSTTILFDSNHDGVLTNSDNVFSYIWNNETKKFKKKINWEEFKNLRLATYDNQTLSEKFMSSFFQHVFSPSKNILDCFPSNINDENEVKEFLTFLQNVYRNLSSSKLSSFKDFDEFASFLINNFKGM